jgi:TniQ
VSKSCLVSQVTAHETYPHWEIKSPPLPARSRLFRLEPFGILTPKVESLTSYVARLSEAHSVSSHLLLRKEIYPAAGRKSSYFSGNLGFSARQINGMDKIAKATAMGLEKLIYRNNLRYMTMWPWGNILCPINLMRSRRAWCPACLEESLVEGSPAYEQLIWTLECVFVCPWHQEWLREICPHCNSPVPALAPFSYPGYCTRCGSWLGTSTFKAERDHSSPPPVTEDELARQLVITHIIGELLSHAPTLTSPPSHERFIANFAKCVERFAGGHINYFSTVVGLWSGMVRRLLAGKTKPRLVVLLQVCSRLNVSLFDLLSGDGNEGMLKTWRTMVKESIPRSPQKVPWGEVKKQLLLALEEHPPPSLEKVARRMGYYQPKLSKNFPDECARIVKRYKEYKRDKRPNPKTIYYALRRALREQTPPSLQAVLRRLGCQNTGYYYYYNYPDLCFAIAKRFKDSRNKPFDLDADRERLQDILLEQPPPPFFEVAKRLGHNREFVRKKFPDLSKAITSRYLTYCAALRKQKAEQFRSEIRTAIRQIVSSGQYASEARVRKHVRKNLPSLGRDSLFKQALREIKAEMGLNG